MRRILCSDWLPERARSSDIARLGLPASIPQVKFRQKFKRVHESFLKLPKLFSAKVKRVFVISLSLWNQKTGKPKASMRMKTKMLMNFRKRVLKQK